MCPKSALVLLGLALATGTICVAQRPAGGGAETLVLAQMFNVEGGDSTVILQNLSSAPQEIFVEFFAPDGSFFDAATATVAGMGEAQVPTPAGAGGFRGSVRLFGDAPFTARGQWNFNLQGNPLAVGVPVLPMSQVSTTFQMPIGSVGPGSLVGVAIANAQGTPIDCTVAYRDPAGSMVAQDQYSGVAGFGQVSEFANGIAEGFEGSGSVQCSGPAAVIAVIQEQVNGFPTPLFATPGN